MSLLEAAAVARHDLGKYIFFQARWLEPDAPEAALRDALRADLLETRKGPSGTRSAASIWAELRPSLVGAGIDAIDDAMKELGARAERLDALDRAALLETARRARAVAEALRALHARLAS